MKGAGRINAALRSLSWESGLAEDLRVDADSKVTLERRPLSLEGVASCAASVRHWDLRRGLLTSVDAKASLSALRGSLRGTGDDLRAARIAFDAKTASWNVEHPDLRGVEMHLSVDDAQLRDAPALQRFIAPGSPWVIESGALHASGDLRVAPETGAEGDVAVGVEHGGVRYHETQMTGDARARFRLAGFDSVRGAADLGGSWITLNNVTVRHAAADASNWSAEATLPHAMLRLSATPEFDADVAVAARDTAPLVAIVLRGALPTLFAGLAEVQRVDATARLRATPGGLALKDVDLHGGDLGVRGFYATGAGGSRGAFVVDKGNLSAGVDVVDGGVGVRLFGLDGWLASQERAAAALLR